MLVVGDIMLDRYWRGNARRISPEAPVPVVIHQTEQLEVGGAANVAANIAGMGAQTFLTGIIGDDEDGRSIEENLREANISANYLIRSRERPTTVKTRIVANNQHIVRIDKEDTTEVSLEDAGKIWNSIEEIFSDTDIFVVSDYAKGTLTENLLLRLITKAADENKIVLIDPKGRDYKKYSGATILTPNLKEAADALQLEDLDDASIDAAGVELLKRFELRALLITRGEKGMTLFQKSEPPLYIDTRARQVFDVTGAGDTVIASLALALGSGAGFYEAAKFANLCAGIIVQQFGTAKISKELVLNELDNINI